MSGRENLRLLAAIDGIGVRQVDQVLERVGLADRSRDAVKKYSLGMRQRLALAAVLLKDPALLILDEPANGLDPAGIRDVRTLLRSLGDEGRTVFLSSHVLAEVEHICDSVAILRRGRCVAQGKVADVMASAARAPPCSLHSTTSTPVTACSGVLRSPSNARTASSASGSERTARRGSPRRSPPSDSGSPSCAAKSAVSKISFSSSPTMRN